MYTSFDKLLDQIKYHKLFITQIHKCIQFWYGKKNVLIIIENIVNLVDLLQKKKVF